LTLLCGCFALNRGWAPKGGTFIAIFLSVAIGRYIDFIATRFAPEPPWDLDFASPDKGVVKTGQMQKLVRIEQVDRRRRLPNNC
jgi:hypothetical protein